MKERGSREAGRQGGREGWREHSRKKETDWRKESGVEMIDGEKEKKGHMERRDGWGKEEKKNLYKSEMI